MKNHKRTNIIQPRFGFELIKMPFNIVHFSWSINHRKLFYHLIFADVVRKRRSDLLQIFNILREEHHITSKTRIVLSSAKLFLIREKKKNF